MSSAGDHAMPHHESHSDDTDGEFASLGRDYVNGLGARAEAVNEALACRDHAALGMLAHQTRGAAGMYGYEELSESAGLLEDAIHEGQDQALILKLADEFIRLMQAISPDP